MKTVTESIFNGRRVVIPMAEVLFIERDMRDKYKGCIRIVFKSTTLNVEGDTWNNIAYLSAEDGQKFMRAWCNYRAELEQDTIADIHPAEELFPGTHAALSALTIGKEVI